MKAELRFIGVVDEAKEISKIKIFTECCEGLKGVDAYSHLIILYWAHLRDTEKKRSFLQVFPRRHKVNVKTGVFACRSPSRPNPVCLCVVELVEVERCTLKVKGLDALEGSPIIDIKPYIPRADSVSNARVPEWTKQGPST